MRRMLDITDINSVAGKKLYKHRIHFNYVGNAGPGVGVSGEYAAIIITPKETPYNNDNGGVEAAVDQGMFLRGHSISVADGKEYDILALPDGGDILINLILFDYTSNTIVGDGCEEFTIVSDTVTEWN